MAAVSLSITGKEIRVHRNTIPQILTPPPGPNGIAVKLFLNLLSNRVKTVTVRWVGDYFYTTSTLSARNPPHSSSFLLNPLSKTLNQSTLQTPLLPSRLHTSHLPTRKRPRIYSYALSLNVVLEEQLVRYFPILPKDQYNKSCSIS